ncbi:MAG: SH3 domain-containing protein [Bacteroidetes bacterium]|nr:MAG: SH3 domain-containing protein [Bacteroidota bacterium]TAG90245.1 MAG: SH3 domain-containing protein [Bacteroidota bacterium]
MKYILFLLLFSVSNLSFGQVGEVFKIVKFSSDGANYDAYISSKDAIYTFDFCNDNDLCFKNIWRATNSSSYGIVKSLQRKEYKDTQTFDNIQELRFIWSFQNTYDNKTGDASVTFKKIIKNYRTDFICKISVLSENYEIVAEGYQETKDYEKKETTVVNDIGFSPFLGETNNSVNLRNEPNVSSVVAKQLYRSNKLYVFSNNDSNGFLKVIDIETGTIGWVSKNYVTYIKKLEINRNDVFQKTGNSDNYNPEVEVKNTSSHKITLIVDQEVYTINPYSSISISVSPKSYNYVASASGVIPISGVQNFANNSRYSWVFSVVRR